MAKAPNIVFDSCSLINLMNSDRLETALSIVGINYYLGPAVYKEVSKIQTQKETVDFLIASGKLLNWPNNINISLISRLYNDYGLGDGETESIAICIETGFSICCDDKKARTASQTEITDDRLMGSLRLLKLAVIENIIKCTDAQVSYIEMLFKGGFLPKNVDNDYFCSAS